jgi:excisionase family DNA binding protein
VVLTVAKSDEDRGKITAVSPTEAFEATQAVCPAPRSMPSMLTVDEVAEFLRVTPRTVHRLAKVGRLQRIRLGHRITRYPIESVEALIHPENEGSPGDDEPGLPDDCAGSRHGLLYPQ